MKRAALILALAALSCFGLRAQEQRDSVVVYDVFENLSDKLNVN